MFRTAIVVMQFMISAHAGLVNYVEGPVNVQLHQQLGVGSPVQTGLQGHAEILLNPGSFLRVGENSTVVLDSVELNQIVVRIVHGKGTGAVRQAVRDVLTDHPLVQSHGTAERHEGGEGATVVRLAS